MSEPFLKWAGGKRYLAEKIVEWMPTSIDCYYEPMVGAGAIFFALEKLSRFKSAKLNDANAELINTYIVIRDRVKELIDHLIDMLILHKKRGKYAEDYFYSVRATLSSEPVSRAARTIYLNRTCFNGLYRVNKTGLFNAPYGFYKKPKICDKENLLAVSRSIQNVTFTSLDFSIAANNIKNKDAAYFDPPYWPVSKGAFTSYTDAGFDSKDHSRLADLAHKLKKKGIHAVFSNADVPQILKLYDGLIIEKVTAPRRINSNGQGRGNVSELLIRTR